MAVKKLIKQNEKRKAELEKQAKENTTSTYKFGNCESDVIKAGTPKDHVIKYVPKESSGVKEGFCPKIGLSKGITKNMDNYESFRVDVWLTDELLPGETPEEGLKRLSEIIDKQIHLEVDAVLNEGD